MSIDADQQIERGATPRALGAQSGVLSGLTEQDATRLLAERGAPRRQGSGRSYASIVRANVLTVFNVILAGFGALTLIFGDWQDALFLGVIVANAAIGITQEVRAKRALDRLSLLVAPHGRVLRGGAVRSVPVDQILVGDVVMLEAGDQVIADGHLLVASDLRLDESILTGESESAGRAAGEEVRSGAFVVEGTGSYRVSAVGAESFAGRLTCEARSFRHPRSPLERAVNRLLYALVALVIVLGAVLGYSLYHRHAHLHAAVATSAAGVVTLIPEGLMLLVSLTYAAAAVRMSRRGDRPRRWHRGRRCERRRRNPRRCRRAPDVRDRCDSDRTHLTAGQEGDRGGLACGGPLRGDGRRRRQRCARVENLAVGDRAGQRYADGAQRIRPGPCLRRFCERPRVGRRRPPRAA